MLAASPVTSALVAQFLVTNRGEIEGRRHRSLGASITALPLRPLRKTERDKTLLPELIIPDSYTSTLVRRLPASASASKCLPASVSNPKVQSNLGRTALDPRLHCRQLSSKGQEWRV